MFVYRIGKTKHKDDLSGEGARLFGGRWNHKFVPCIYTSESRALALLEYTVNVMVENIPDILSITTIEIPDNLITEIQIESLPLGWNMSPTPSITKDFGTKLLKRGADPVLRLPSSIITREYNYILNPRHAESKNFSIIDMEDFVYDKRIKTV
jgi:RES domain-containing protein